MAMGAGRTDVADGGDDHADTSTASVAAAAGGRYGGGGGGAGAGGREKEEEDGALPAGAAWTLAAGQGRRSRALRSGVHYNQQPRQGRRVRAPLPLPLPCAHTTTGGARDTL